MDSNLISVVTTTEHSIHSGKSETQIYLKMYTTAVSSGLLADMGAKNWQTLCVVASFMDEQGRCYPTQQQIGRALGISQQAASKRIANLLAYRWGGKPLMTASKERAEFGKWDNTRYTVLPISQLRIFDGEPESI